MLPSCSWMWQHPRRTTPDYHKVVKPNHSWPVIHRVVFSYSRPGVSHISLRPHKYNREGRRKRSNEQTWTWASSKRKKGESVWHFSCSLPCFCRLSRTSILRETFTKPRGMLTHLWLSSLTVSFCWLSFPWTAISSRPSSSALLYQLLSLAVFSWTFLPSSTSSLAGDLVLIPLSGFRAKTDKEIV